ncbi:MAG: hypothetical protein IKB02_05560 [Clostridia bacterium]|nr:hypothetical protein [Clostridia bacterium]
MAILIPSKNIYNISENNKVLDNKITKVSLENYLVYPSDQHSSPVLRNTILSPQTSVTETNSINHDWERVQASNVAYYYACAYQQDSAGYYVGTIEMPQQVKNGYVEKLYREEGDIVELKYYGDRTTQVITSQVYMPSSGENFNKDAQLSTIVAGEQTIEENILLEIPDMPITTIEEIGMSELSQVLRASVQGVTNTSYANARIENGMVVVNFKALTRFTTDSMKGNDAVNTSDYPRIPMTGTRTTYSVKEIQLIVYGNTIQVDLETNTVVYGDNSQKNITLSSNELIQNGSKFLEGSLTQHLAQSILSDYKNGKETAVIKCSIGEYYDDIGDLRLSTKQTKFEISEGDITYDTDDATCIEFKITRDQVFPFDILIDYTVDTWNISERRTALIPKFSLSVTETLDVGNESIPEDCVDRVYTQDTIPMAFVEGDVVIPYIMGANGYNEPISAYNNGEAKLFKVVGTNIYYDGAVWQELTLQEV